MSRTSLQKIFTAYLIIIISTGEFDFDICRFVCSVRIWKRQANSCGINLPNIPDTIDTSLSEVEQWNMAVSWWTTLRDVWSAEGVRRGLKVTSPTPNLGNYFVTTG